MGGGLATICILTPGLWAARTAALLIWILPILSQRVQAFSRIPISSETISSPYDLVGDTLPYSPEYQKVPWFPEKLTFEVKWGVLKMGYATLESEEIVEFNGEPAYHVVSTAKTSRFADKFYKVRDNNESWIHAKDFKSLGYIKQLREGKFYRDEWVLYDYPEKKFLSKRVNRDQSFEYDLGEIPGIVQDILSSLYYVRPKPLKVGDEIVLDVNTKRTWPLVIKVLRKKVLKTPAGRFRTVIVEPFLRDEGIFIQKGKRLQLYLTNDKRHMPVLLKVEIIFGHISAYLIKVEK